MRTLGLCGASCKRRSFFYCTRAAWKSLQLLPLLMVEGYVGRSWAVWTGEMGRIVYCAWLIPCDYGVRLVHNPA
jgi:hypothetical protein